MGVYDRWHLTHPGPDDEPCEHSRGRTKLCPSTEHGQGKRYLVRWKGDDGEPKKRSFERKTGSDPEKCADAFDAKIQSELHAGTYIDPTAGQVTLETFTRRWRGDLTGDPVTLANVDDRLAHIIGAKTPEGVKSRRLGDGSSTIAKRPMKELAKKPSSIQSWVKSLEAKGLSAGYIHHIVTLLSTVFNAAVIDGVVNRNPVQTKVVDPPKVVPKRIVPWTREQIRAAGVALGGRDAAMADLGAATGMRQGEIFAFGEDEIDWSGQMIHVIRQVRLIGKTPVFSLPKRDKTRDVPLSDSLALMLLMQIEQYPPVEVTLPWDAPDGDPHTVRLLFARADGRAHHRKSFSYTWPRARRAAGVPDTRENGMHAALRHTFASLCLSEGVDVRTLADWLGHKDPGFTLRVYAHLMPSAAEKGRKAVDSFFDESALKVPSER